MAPCKHCTANDCAASNCIAPLHGMHVLLQWVHFIGNAHPGILLLKCFEHLSPFTTPTAHISHPSTREASVQISTVPRSPNKCANI